MLYVTLYSESDQAYIYICIYILYVNMLKLKQTKREVILTKHYIRSWLSYYVLFRIITTDLVRPISTAGHRQISLVFCDIAVMPDENRTLSYNSLLD